MDDFLAKPIQAAGLWAAIDRIVRKDEGGRMKDEKEDASAPGSSFILPRLTSYGAGLLDPGVLLAACGGDPIILERICQAFRARLPDHVTAIQDALETGTRYGLGRPLISFAGWRLHFPPRPAAWRPTSKTKRLRASSKSAAPGGTARSDGRRTGAASKRPVARNPSTTGWACRRRQSL